VLPSIPSNLPHPPHPYLAQRRIVYLGMINQGVPLSCRLIPVVLFWRVSSRQRRLSTQSHGRR
jgi:hypothetical protein